MVWRVQKTGGVCHDSKSYSCELISPANLPTDCLVIVGFLGVFAAFFTLKSIRHQAVQMRKQTKISERSAAAAKDSANAALLNAQAVINSERPFIEGELVRDEETKKISVVRYVLKIRNYGKTPAYLLDYKVERKVSNPTKSFKVIDFDATRTTTLNRYLGSDATDFFDQFNMKDTFDGCESGTLHFTIRYTDMLGAREGREMHETSFLYCYNPLIEKLDRVNAANKYT